MLATLCLSFARFEEHCLTVGRGLLLPQYLASLACVPCGGVTHSRLFGNVYSRFAALLERYAALKKQQPKDQTPRENAFDWNVFQVRARGGGYV